MIASGINRSVHTIPDVAGVIKKLGATTHDTPAFQSMRALAKEVEPLVEAMKTLKPVIKKGRVAPKQT